MAENKGNMKLVIKEWSYNFNKPCNLSLIVSYRSGHYGQLCSPLIIIFLLSIHYGHLYYIWRALVLNNITVKAPGEILATLTSPQGDMIVNKTFCLLYVWGFFSFVFQICLSKMKNWNECQLEKKWWTVLIILHLLLPLWICSLRWSLPQNYITWYLLPSDILLFSTNKRHYYGRKGVRGQSYQVLISTTPQLPPPNPWFWQWPSSSV